MSVLWRKRQHTHLELVSSDELFARRLPSSADTLPSVSTGRRCSSGALLQLQVQLTALAVLQLQRADTPEFVSASIAPQGEFGGGDRACMCSTTTDR